TDNVIIDFPVTVTFDGGSFTSNTITGTTGAALVFAPNTVSTLDGATLNADVLLGSSAKIRVLNGLTLIGTATLNGGLNITELNFDGTQTLDRTGQVVFTDANPVTTRVQPVDGTLTIGPNISIHGRAGTI